MFGIINFEAFLLAGIILNLTPGADTIYILGRSISQGKKAGIISAIGISTGAIVHCLFAALGLSIILTQSALAFEIVKYVGAAYLIFLGIKMLISKPNKNFKLKNNYEKVNYIKIYISGVFTNILNPKVALFFLAFLPQFINHEHAQNFIPFVILGFTFVFTGTIWGFALACFSSKLFDKIRANYKIKKRLNTISGGIFITLGIKLASTQK